MTAHKFNRAAARELAIQRAIEENKNVTHAQFVVGMQNGLIGFRCHCEPIRLVRGIRKVIFNVLVLLYQVGPLLLVPLWAYHESNWWLLIGIVVSWMGAGRVACSPAVVLKGKTVGGFLGLVCIASWIALGIHNWFTFFCLCALWGCLLFQMAEEAQHEYAMQSLLENPELFHRVMAQGMITVSGRWHKHPVLDDWQGGEPDRAIADCTNAIQLGLRWPGIYLDRGRAHAAKGEYDEAIADYTETIRLDPKSYEAHQSRGIAYKAKGEHEKAALDAEQCDRVTHEAWGTP